MIKFREKTNSEKAFTLIEILIYTGIFAIISSLLVGMLVIFSRIDATQNATAEVANQANFVLSQIRRLTAASSAFEVRDVAGQTELWLYLKNYTTNPSKISLSGGAMTLSEAGGPATPLTTSRVVVDSLVFEKFANPPGPDVVSVNMVISYNAGSPAESHSRNFRTAIARVSAATFDSDIVPNSDNSLDVGVSGQRFKNAVFSGGIGLGIDVPISPVRLEIDGGMRLNTAIAKPACGAGMRGTFWVTQGGAGVKDNVEVCAKDAANIYAWRVIY